jgi:two-component system, NarL family, invasion response regulator UvrY
MFHILIADDHSIVRHGLSLLAHKALGEIDTIDYAKSGDEVLELLRKKKYSLLLSDLVMPDRKGTSLIKLALELQPGLRIIIVSVGSERDFGPRCMESGAYAYINKGASDLTFTKTIQSVAYDSSHNLEYNRKEIVRSRAEKVMDQHSFLLLSQREREVIMLLLQGQGMMEIAKTLSISPSTASTLKGRAFTKLKVHSVIELSHLAYTQGIRPEGNIPN